MNAIVPLTTRLRWYNYAVIRLGLLALVIGLVSTPAQSGASTVTQAAPVVVLLGSNQPSYQLGSVVTFSIAVDNPSNSPVTLSFSSAQQYDIVVLADEIEVWRWSGDRVFAAVMMERSFQPGLTLLGRETWDWRDSNGVPLPPGTYRVVATLAGSPPVAGNVLEISLSAPWNALGDEESQV